MLKPKTLLLLATIFPMLALSSQAQLLNTNLIPAPATILENLEMTPNQLIIKATLPVGSLNINGIIVNIVCKEDTIPASNRKEHGIYIDVGANGTTYHNVIDFDELDSLINAVDYINNVNRSITSLSSFSVIYTTKAGLRVAAYSSKRSGQIEFSLRNGSPPFEIKLAPEQCTEFRALLDQARTKLIALRNG